MRRAETDSSPRHRPRVADGARALKPVPTGRRTGASSGLLHHAYRKQHPQPHAQQNLLHGASHLLSRAETLDALLPTVASTASRSSPKSARLPTSLA
jgi:hypothetical protein